MTPEEIRETIYEACEELEGSRISDGFKSLMDYVDCDTLVGWFVDEVCAGDVGDVITEGTKADAIEEWYQLHCQEVDL